MLQTQGIQTVSLGVAGTHINGPGEYGLVSGVPIKDYVGGVVISQAFDYISDGTVATAIQTGDVETPDATWSTVGTISRSGPFTSSGTAQVTSTTTVDTRALGKYVRTLTAHDGVVVSHVLLIGRLRNVG